MGIDVRAVRVAVLAWEHDAGSSLPGLCALERMIAALDALCNGERGALARLKSATHAWAAELSDHAIPSSLAVAAVTDLVAKCWAHGSVPAPAPLVREALVDVVGWWCGAECDRLARANAEQRTTAVQRLG